MEAIHTCHVLFFSPTQCSGCLAPFFSFKLPTVTLPMATADVQEIRATSYVGFDSITQQIEHKLLKRGFQFNVIVVGMSHLPL